MHVDIGNGTIIDSSSNYIIAENISEFYCEGNELNNPLSCHHYEHRHPLQEESSRKGNSTKQSSTSGSVSSRLVIDTYSALEKYTSSNLLKFPYQEQGGRGKHHHNKRINKERKDNSNNINNNESNIIDVEQEKPLYQDEYKEYHENYKSVLNNHNLLAHYKMTNQESSGAVAGAMRKMHTSKIINVDSTPSPSSPMVPKSENVNVKSPSQAASEQRERKRVSHVMTTSATTARANTTHTKNNKNYSNNNSMYNIETTTNPNTEDREKVMVAENVNNFFVDRSVDGEGKNRRKYNEQAQLSQRSKQRWLRGGSNTTNRSLKRRSVAVDTKQGATRTSPEGNSRSHHDAELPVKESSKNTTGFSRDVEQNVGVVEKSNNNCSITKDNKKIINVDSEGDKGGGKFTVKAVRRTTSEHSKQNVENNNYIDKKVSEASYINGGVNAIVPVIAENAKEVCYNEINTNNNNKLKDELDDQNLQNNKDSKLQSNQEEGANNNVNVEKKVDNNASNNIDINKNNNNNVKKVEGKPRPQLAQTKIQLGMQLKRWVIFSRIGAGSFGETFTAIEVSWPPPPAEDALRITPEAAAFIANPPPIERRREVCIKVEQESKNVLRLEALALKKVQPCMQVVRYYASGCTCGMNYLVMEKLGPNLAELRRRSPHGTFNIFTTLKAGISCLQAIRGVHEQGLVHRDIKPSNFVTGLPGTSAHATCFLIDFGLARRFKRSSGEIRPARANAGFRGTSRYASVASHQHAELGRVDDIWSLLFMLVEFATGSLPWRKYKDKESIGQCKEESIGPYLVRNLPREFQPFLSHLTTLTYDDEPNYDYLLSLMHAALKRRGYPPDKLVDWQLDDASLHMTAEAEYHQHPGRVPREDVKPTRFSVNGVENNNNIDDKPHRMLAPTRSPNDNVVALPEIVHNPRESRVNREQVAIMNNISNSNNISRHAHSGVNAITQEGESRNDGNFPSLPVARSIPSHFANDNKLHVTLPPHTPLALAANTHDKCSLQNMKESTIPHAELEQREEEEEEQQWHSSWQKQQQQQFEEQQKRKEREHHKHQEQQQYEQQKLFELQEPKLEYEQHQNDKQKSQGALSPLHARRVNKLKEDGVNVNSRVTAEKWSSEVNNDDRLERNRVNGKRDNTLPQHIHSQHEEEEEEHKHLANHNNSFHESGVFANNANEQYNHEDNSHNTYNSNNNNNIINNNNNSISHIDRHLCEDKNKMEDDDDDEGDGDVGISQPLLHSAESSMQNREMELNVNAPPAVLAVATAAVGLERKKESKQNRSFHSSSSSSSEASSSSEFSAKEGHELENKMEQQGQAANENNSTGVYYMKRQDKRTSSSNNHNNNNDNNNSNAKLSSSTRVANAAIASEHSPALQPQAQLQSPPSSISAIASNHLSINNEGVNNVQEEIVKQISKDVNEEHSTTHRDACMSNKSHEEDGVFVEELFSPREGSMSMSHSQSTKLPVLVKTSAEVNNVEEQQIKEVSSGAVHVKSESESSPLPASAAAATAAAQNSSVNTSQACYRSDANAIGSPSPLQSQSQSKVNPELNNKSNVLHEVVSDANSGNGGGGVVPLLSPPLSTSSSDAKRRSRHSVRPLYSTKSGKKSLAEATSLCKTSTEQENNSNINNNNNDTRRSNNSNTHHDNYCDNDVNNSRTERQGKHRVKCSCGTCTVMEEHWSSNSVKQHCQHCISNFDVFI